MKFLACANFVGKSSRQDVACSATKRRRCNYQLDGRDQEGKSNAENWYSAQPAFFSANCTASLKITETSTALRQCKMALKKARRFRFVIPLGNNLSGKRYAKAPVRCALMFTFFSL